MVKKQKTKEIPKPETKPEPKKITFEDIWKQKTFSIPGVILKDFRQENNALLSEDEFRKIMAESFFKEGAQKKKYKRKFQYF